jgi:hypothetical protein
MLPGSDDFKHKSIAGTVVESCKRQGLSLLRISFWYRFGEGAATNKF